MSEAILFYLRKGKKVVAVFYGHPGIFALSTHRAIKIAKREGHHATMFPGISALDCLCADLGVDPSYPGMQTFEATDMLLRLREPDIYSHVILWQVGFVGEMGYSRKGFVNDKFVILANYLENFYGADFEITHYIASNYPTIAPVVEIIKIGQLVNTQVRSNINANSTFYLPPKEARQTDKNMAVMLGLLDEADQPAKAPRLMVIDRYEKREMDAIAQFKDFVIPENYQYQYKTRPAEFIIRLCFDAEFSQLYKCSGKLFFAI